ncbi:MAG: nucleoside triphosphate pyrophosphohydrolase [Desulfotomaculaceae bacterium]|nr:nucleoside triphosphate pyrophosphohydrolase [Desulfotomaculaceae bacterium]
MPSHARITIAGLGAGAFSDLTMGVWEALKGSSCTYLRTANHPVVEWLRNQGINFQTFDGFYEDSSSFGEVYERIAGQVIEEARRAPVLYAVPGHPLVAEESVRLVIEKAEEESLEVAVLPAVSFLDAIYTSLRLDPGKGLQVVDGLRLEDRPPLPVRPAVITQVYSRLIASDVKLSLMEIYPPEHPVTVVRAAGIMGEERTEIHPLFELDRLDWVDHLTSVYLPEVCCGKGDVRRDNWDAETGSKSGGKACAEINEAEGGVLSEGATGQAVDSGQAKMETGATEFVQVFEVNGQTESDCHFPLDPLVNIMARLRGEGGCPWDQEQDHQSLKPYLIEEAYEVLEALDQEDMYKICEELGDLLLQIIFHAQLAKENRQFDINDVIAGINEKLIRRHPHVFGSVNARDSREVVVNWEKIKLKEREGEAPKSLLAYVPVALPALMRANKLQKAAARVGFDWPNYQGAYDKTREELSELKAAIIAGDRLEIAEEVGDLIFSAVNLARLLGIEPEGALTKTSAKFIRRFEYVENMARVAGKDLSHFTLAEMDKWWEEAKKLEKI